MAYISWTVGVLRSLLRLPFILFFLPRLSLSNFLCVTASLLLLPMPSQIRLVEFHANSLLLSYGYFLELTSPSIG